MTITDPAAFTGDDGFPEDAAGSSAWLVGLRNDGIGTGQATFRLICAS